MAFKMKGSPMYRNFGVGEVKKVSPMKGLLDLIPIVGQIKKLKEAKKVKNIVQSEWEKHQESEEENIKSEEENVKSEDSEETTIGGKIRSVVEGVFGGNNPFSKT